MSLVRFDLSQEMNDLRREVNRAFSTMPFVTPMSGFDGIERWAPAMDTVEQDGELRITLDLPGMEEQDIDVEVRGDQLFIRGTRRIERESEDQMWHRFERASGEFERGLRLPEGVDASAVKASFDKGVLSVVVPIPAEVEPAARHIQISRGSAS